MVKVYLVQHGKSLPENVDPKRPLSAEGIAETERISLFLKRIGLKVDQILHSTRLRAKQTAEIFAKNLNVKNILELDILGPNDDPKLLLERLEKIERDVMVVGHLPHLSRTLSVLLEVEKEVLKFTYSGVVCLNLENRIIEWYMTPDLVGVKA